MRLSVQLYSLRKIARLDDQLDLVRSAGLAHVEATTANYADPVHFRTLLDRRGLIAPSGHVGLGRVLDDLDATIALARTIGMQRLVLWGLPDENRPSDAAGWQDVGLRLGRVAASLQGFGIAFAFHNHDWEYGRLPDGRYGLDHLFAGAYGTPLEWQPDFAWCARAGVDVDAAIAAYSDLIRTAHIKDLAPAGTAIEEDGWADLGTGTLPWTAWWPRLQALGVDLFVLEHDEPSDPQRFLSTSAEAARALARMAKPDP